MPMFAVMDQQRANGSTDGLARLFRDWAGAAPTEITQLPKAGSDRDYYRLRAGATTAIGVYNPDRRENAAFTSFTRHFHAKGVPVPGLYADAPEACIYLQEDLGDTSLLAHLQSLRTGPEFPAEVIPLYQKSLAALADMQIRGAEGLDFSLCFPRERFDRQSMRWDLNYFKYYFLKLARIPFDEEKLENDFTALADYLMQARTGHFLFRDFQARNIMLPGGKPRFIDYQGGRKGALQYDPASLLYQAKADLPHELRMSLLDHYIDAVREQVPVDREQFREFFFGYLLIRTLQVLGAYGFRGLYERRPHFLDSIPFALGNLAWIMENARIPVELPALRPALAALPDSETLGDLRKKWDQPTDLTVHIRSFSYKSGLPEDPGGNGGGFIFDCRALHNPGRYAPYKQLTGRDRPVIDFLLENSRIESFLADVRALVEPSVQRYIERGFTDLMVSFGCTGGQHRSVYCADRLAEMLRSKYKVRIDLAHIEQEKKGWRN